MFQCILMYFLLTSSISHQINHTIINITTTPTESANVDNESNHRFDNITALVTEVNDYNVTSLNATEVIVTFRERCYNAYVNVKTFIINYYVFVSLCALFIIILPEKLTKLWQTITLNQKLYGIHNNKMHQTILKDRTMIPVNS